jgi:AraC family transcriptional regulator
MLPPPRFETIEQKQLVGQRMTMNFADNKTFQLWNGFMPRRHEIANPILPNLYAIQVYPDGFFQNADMHTPFDKWATVEVANFEQVPEGMETYTLPAGLYAVFFYKGSAANAAQVFRYILREWLPASDYILDNRPQFEILGEKFNRNSDESEEEIWIPVKAI